MKSPRGVTYSALLHATLLFFMLFGLPRFLHREPEREPEAISVEILPMAPISNVKPQEKPPEKEEKKPEQKETARKETQATKQEEEKPKEEPHEQVKADDVVPEPKPEKEKPKPKKKDEDLDSILKSVEQTAKAEPAKTPTHKTPTNAKPAKSEHYDNTQPLSMSEKDAIRSQVQKCWTMPAGAKNAEGLAVTLHLTVAQDGTVTLVELARDESRYASDSFFRAAADSAIRAVHRCSPLKDLPADKYTTWSDMEFTFDPKDVLY